MWNEISVEELEDMFCESLPPGQDGNLEQLYTRNP